MSPASSSGTGPRIDWQKAGRSLASRLLASDIEPFRLSDLRFRFGALERHHGERLAALAPPPGDEAAAPGQWVRHVDGREMYMTPARAAAEREFNRGWDEVVSARLRDRTRNQVLPGEDPARPNARPPDCLVVLGLARGCTLEDVGHAYKELALGAHPDVGGDHDLFLRLGRARDEAIAWIERRDRRPGRR